MIKIHRLKQPNKRSGFALEGGKTTTVRGVVITNKNSFTVYVDKFTRKAPELSAAAKKKKTAAKPVAKKKKVAASAAK